MCGGGHSFAFYLVLCLASFLILMITFFRRLQFTAPLLVMLWISEVETIYHNARRCSMLLDCPLCGH